MNAFSSRRAFTLIELLVVIAIIAILAAILFPVFAQAREKARSIVCVSNLKSTGLAAMMYAQDYDEYLPGGWGYADNNACGATSDAGRLRNSQYWRFTLQPYIQKMTGAAATSMWDTTGASRNTIYQCPSRLTDDSMKAITSVGINADEVCAGTPWDGTNLCNNVVAGKSLANISQPASLVMFADAATIKSAAGLVADPQFNQGSGNCADKTGNGPNDPATCGPFTFQPEKWKQAGGWATCDWNFGVTGTAGDWRPNAQGDPGSESRRPVFYHSGQADVSFVDGHVKTVSSGTLKVKVGSPEDIWHNK
jgi:prepilin-type N-terminal cleavage/methylation domain-containing protein/prepilin-type processing-associated H-X9-DG protein